MPPITQVENCLMVCFSAFPITSCRIIVPFFVKFGDNFVPAADLSLWTLDYPQGFWENCFDHLPLG